MEKFNCKHCDKCGFCRLYSRLGVVVPCSENSDCDGYREVDDENE